MKSQNTYKFGTRLLLILLMAASPISAELRTDAGAEGVVIRQRKAADTVRVLCANIRLPLPSDKGSGNEWNLRKDLCGEVLAAQNADLICIQEGRAAHMKTLKNALPGYKFYDIGIPLSREKGFYDPANAIFWRTERFEKKDSGGQRLGGSRTRYVTWVLLKDKSNGRELMVYNTHLSAGSDNYGKRLTQAKELVAFTKKAPEARPKILTGDFNSKRDTDPMRIIMKSEWRDSYAGIHGTGKHDTTYHRFQGPKYVPSNPVDARIDFIFHNKQFNPLDAEIIRDHRNGRYPSDHYFISVEFEYSK